MIAPISFRIKRDTAEVERLLKHLSKGADKVLTRALNKTIKSVERKAVQGMAKDLRLTQKTVRKSVKLFRARWNFKVASITVSGKRIPIYAFGARQVRGGVTYKGRSGGRKLIKGAFIARMPSGHMGVFKRKGSARLPIQELLGPSPPRVFQRPDIVHDMNKEADIRWKKNLDHELKWFLRNA